LFFNITNIDSDDDAGDITDIDYTNKDILIKDQHDYGSSSIYISSNSEPPRKLASFSQSNNTYYFYILIWGTIICIINFGLYLR